MNPVFRALMMFGVLWIIFRVGGRRTLAEITTFDFILLLIIGDAAQNALVGEDFSITTAALVIATLLLTERGVNWLSASSPSMKRIIDSAPVVVVDDGQPLEKALQAEGVDIQQVLNAARERHGLERLDQIKYAIVERHGGISIVPKDDK